MTEADQQESPPTEQPRPSATGVTVAVPLFAVGWFLLEWRLMGETPGNAIGEALGAGLGLLVAVSVVGAVRSARRARRQGLDQEVASPEGVADTKP